MRRRQDAKKVAEETGGHSTSEREGRTSTAIRTYNRRQIKKLVEVPIGHDINQRGKNRKEGREKEVHQEEGDSSMVYAQVGIGEPVLVKRSDTRMLEKQRERMKRGRKTGPSECRADRGCIRNY